MLPIQIQSAATVRLSGCACSVDGDCLVNLALAVLVLCNQIQQTARLKHLRANKKARKRSTNVLRSRAKSLSDLPGQIRGL